MNYSEFEVLYRASCHYDRHLGLELTVHEPGRITYRLQVDERHLSSPNACHGGVIAGMMDATLGITALSWAIVNGKFCATVEFKTHFFTPVRPGGCLEGTGEIDFTGARLLVSTAHIVETASQQLVAKGMGTFNLYPISKRQDLLELWQRVQPAR
jgi:uncharacterized protein (TIGR00369 family)